MCGYEKWCINYLWRHNCQDCIRLDDDRDDNLEFPKQIIDEARNSGNKLCIPCPKTLCSQCMVVMAYIKEQENKGREFEECYKAGDI